MLNPVILFSNLFRSSKINSTRLYTFGIAVLQALILANDSNQFDGIINQLTKALAALKQENAGVDINLTSQKTETETVDAFIVSFYRFMSENEPFIARQLGGRGSAGFKAFYPFGTTEYSNATKNEMPTLTERIKMAAIKNASKLEPGLAAELQAFDADFAVLYTSQQSQIQAVKTDRTDRNSAFVNAQLALTQAVYTVGMQYPGEVEKCGSFFPFAMLYPHTKRESLTVEGSLAKNGVATLLNRQLLKSAVIIVQNTGDNASFAVWMAASATEPMPAGAVVVSATSNAVTLKANRFSDLEKNTFFMIKNISDVNVCSYKVTFKGLQRKNKTVEATDAPAVMEVLSA